MIIHIRFAGAAGGGGWFNRRTLVVVFSAMAFAAFSEVAQAGPVTNNLVFWVDADDLDGDGVSEGLGESGQTAGSVATWVNKSAINGAPTATQGSALFQPTLTLGALNGRPVVRFDGLDDYLQSASFTTALAQPTEMYIVWKADSNGSPGGGFFACIAVDGNSGSARQAVTYEFIGGQGGDSLTMYGGAPTFGALIFNSTFSAPIYETAMFNGASSTMRVNGQSVAAFNVNGGPGTESLGGVTLGGRYDLFGGDRLTLDGYIAELLIYSSPLNTTDRDAVESYLNGHWSIVPEPTATLLLAVGGLLLFHRRCR